MYDVLVIGADGMVGSAVFRYLKNRSQILGTSRRSSGIYYPYTANHDLGLLRSLLSNLNIGGLVINCVAILDVESRMNAGNSFYENIEVNAVFPHLLSKECGKMGLRLIHISTDAVFGSATGELSESAAIAPSTIYGMTKALGEVKGENVLTIRTSIIGPSYGEKKSGLWNWISNSKRNSTLQGYINNYWTGVTTLQFSYLCCELLERKCYSKVLANAGSVQHLSINEPITKYELISKIAKKIRPDLKVVKAISKSAINRQIKSDKGELNKLLTKLDWDTEIDKMASW